MKKLSLVVLLVFLVGCIPYFSQVCKVSTVDTMESILCRINVTGLDAKANTPLEGKAIGFTIGNGYIVALSHAATIPDFIRMRTPFGIVGMPRPVKDIRYFVGEHELTLAGKFEDISVFYSPHFLNSPALPFADINNIKVGTKVYAIGYSYAKLFNFKDGIISVLNIPDGVYAKNSVKCFLTTCPANPGDSGSPLVALHNGEPQIVGIICATIKDKGMSFAFKCDYVQDAIAGITKAFESLMKMG